MISVLIKLLIVAFVIISINTFENKVSHGKAVIKAIIKNYSELINQQSTIIKFVLKACGIMMLILFYLISFEKCCLDDGREVSLKNVIISVVIWIIISLLMYFGLGCLLVIFSKTVTLIGNVKNFEIEIKMLSSFLLLVILTFFSIVSENELRENLPLFCVGLITSYVLNIQIMLKLVRNPFCILEDNNKRISENRVLIIFSSILIVLMIIVNLYLLVLWAHFSYNNAYKCNYSVDITKWELFYYTVITFTTVGYGDIYPAVFQSQVVAVLISVTSVMCLAIFVSSILSVKDVIFNDNTGIEKMK